MIYIMKSFITLIFLLLISYILTVNIGQSCTGYTDCFENAECSLDLCACKANYVANEDNTACLADISAIDCSGGESACTNVDANSKCVSNACSCKTGFSSTLKKLNV